MGDVKYETNLGRFVPADGQRPASQRRVKAIKRAILEKNLLESFPIVGSEQEDGTIVVYDGQHRLEAARAAKVEGIWWIDSPDIKMSDIAKANSAQRPWKLGDYLGSWASQGFADYVELLRIVESYSTNISVIINAMLPALQGRRISDEFKAGTWRCDKLEDLELWVMEVQELEKYDLKLRLQGQMSAWLHLRQHPDYRHENMISRLELYPRKPLVRGSMREMVMDLLKIHNYKLIKNGIPAEDFNHIN